MKKNNVVLIGMPGAGKSTLGVILAKTLKMPFVDTDLLIQQRENRLLQEIINQEGIEAFLQIEESVIADLNVCNSIIATGGSAVYSEAAMKHLKENGFVVYLKLGLGEIERRIRNIKTRGIVMDAGQGLYHIYRERTPLYEKHADMILNCAGRNKEDLINEIKTRYEEI